MLRVTCGDEQRRALETYSRTFENVATSEYAFARATNALLDTVYGCPDFAGIIPASRVNQEVRGNRHAPASLTSE
jgi:hypothetical protein